MSGLDSDDLNVGTGESIGQAPPERKHRGTLLTVGWAATAIIGSAGWLYLIVRAVWIVVNWFFA
jgi:hypothetical protein